MPKITPKLIVPFLLGGGSLLVKIPLPPGSKKIIIDVTLPAKVLSKSTHVSSPFHSLPSEPMKQFQPTISIESHDYRLVNTETQQDAANHGSLGFDLAYIVSVITSSLLIVTITVRYATNTSMTQQRMHCLYQAHRLKFI